MAPSTTSALLRTSTSSSNKNDNNQKNNNNNNNNNNNLRVPPASDTNFRETSSSSSSINNHQATSTQTLQQRVPSSPTKKMKLSHSSNLPRPNGDQSTITSNPNSKKKTKPRIKQISKISGSSNRSTSSTPKPQSSIVLLTKFSLKVLICYLLLAYFYFCPRDPSQNPLVCSNLAELHWALEPHLSPHLNNLNQNFGIPLRNRANRKLGPICRDYVQPTWRFVYPKLRQLSNRAILKVQSSGLVDLIDRPYRLHVVPVIDRASKVYEEQARPLVSSYAEDLDRSLRIVRKSKFIKNARIYLVRLSTLANRAILRPLRLKVIPSFYKNYLRYVRPRLIKGLNAFYERVIVGDHPIKQGFKNLKRWYRTELLKWLQSMRAIYVTPHLNKIAKKLMKNQSRESALNETVQKISKSNVVMDSDQAIAEQLNDPEPIELSGTDHTASSEKVESRTETKEDDEPLSSPEDAATTTSGVGEEDTIEEDEQEEAKEPDEVEEIEPETLQTEENSTSFEGEQVFQPVDLGDEDDHLESPDEEAEILKEEDIVPLDEEGDDDEEEGEEESVEQGSDEDEEEYSQPPKGSAESFEMDDGLIEDVDDLMEEIKKDKLRESEELKKPVTRPRTEEETVEERKRLETIRDEGFSKMGELESTQLKRFVKKINQKRNDENLDRLDGFLKASEEKLRKIESESKKLVEKVDRWFEKNELKELKTVEEKLEDVKLVVRKTNEKFKSKMIDSSLMDIENFGRGEYVVENKILEDAWEVVDNHSTNVQAVLGAGFTWLDGVTYKDWASFHKFRIRSNEFKAKLENMMIGNQTEFSGLINRYDFFRSIESIRDRIISSFKKFEEDLIEVESKRVKRLIRMKELREIEAEKDYQRRLKNGEDVRTVEDLKGMSEDEIRAVAADAIKSLLSKNHEKAKDDKVKDGHVKTDSPSEPLPTSINKKDRKDDDNDEKKKQQKKKKSEEEEMKKLADLAKNLMLKNQKQQQKGNDLENDQDEEEEGEGEDKRVKKIKKTKEKKVKSKGSEKLNRGGGKAYDEKEKKERSKNVSDDRDREGIVKDEL